MQLNRLLLIAIAVVALQGCSATLRDVQGIANAKNIYGNSSVKEEVVWKIRSIYGQ
jgi:hypothetical protein